jgi:predicted RNase H-like nuclease (RuvC/YqgF family)
MSDYTDKINALESQFKAALNDYKKAYVLYKSNPTFDEYKNNFFSLQKNIKNMNSSLFIVTNEIETNIDSLNNEINKIGGSLEKEKNKDEELSKKLLQINRGISSADVMRSNYNELYFVQYVKNLTTILGIFMVSVIFVRTFKLK